MRVISIGSDRLLFDAKSPARMRMMRYAALLGELHIVVFALRSREFTEVHEGALHIYPTNSRGRAGYIIDAARMARHLPGEVVTVQDPFESGLAGLLGRRGRPLHVQLHTDPYSPHFRGMLNRVRRLLMPWVLHRAARVRVVSQRVKASVQKAYPHLSVSVLPIFVDTQKFAHISRAKHPQFGTTLLWVGRFEKEKNPALALEALAAARAAGHDAGLVMLGAGSLEALLRDLAKKLSIEAWVEFAGWQDPHSYYAVADAVLVTSEYEGYGLVIVEALAAGVPVIATNVGVAREAGAIVAPREAYVPAVLEWLRTGPRRGELQNYPYTSFDEYAAAYCADIQKCAIVQ